MKVDWDILPLLPDVKIGQVEFYNIRRAEVYGREIVQFYIGSDAFFEGYVENSGQPVTMDRRSWDAMIAGIGTADSVRS